MWNYTGFKRLKWSVRSEEEGDQDSPSVAWYELHFPGELSIINTTFLPEFPKPFWSLWIYPLVAINIFVLAILGTMYFWLIISLISIHCNFRCIFGLFKHRGVLVAQSCLTLCKPTDCSPPGSSVHGILQSRILEWVAIPFSSGSPQAGDWTQVSHIAGRFFTLWATMEAIYT